jgi:hypothetical protein
MANNKSTTECAPSPSGSTFYLTLRISEVGCSVGFSQIAPSPRSALRQPFHGGWHQQIRSASRIDPTTQVLRYPFGSALSPSHGRVRGRLSSESLRYLLSLVLSEHSIELRFSNTVSAVGGSLEPIAIQDRDHATIGRYDGGFFQQLQSNRNARTTHPEHH